MPIYSYKVANKEGKNLSGTVEAPDEQTARTELNNLGFSIIEIKETKEKPKLSSNLKMFNFEALDKSSKQVSGTIPAENQQKAFEKLDTEYSLNVTAIWEEGASEEEIKEARKTGTQSLQDQLVKEEEKAEETDLKVQKEEQFTKTKIEFILNEIHKILQIFDKDLPLDQKAEINKRINKLLRIKQSKNLTYVLSTAEQLLKYIQDQEQEIHGKNQEDKRIQLHMQTKGLLEELKKSTKPKTISEDIISKIEKWEKDHEKEEKSTKQFIAKALLKIKNFFTTPPQLKAIKDQIKVYNRQLWEFAKLYFKEPTKEYKAKVKNSIKTIWKARKKAVHSLAQAKKLLKQRKKEKTSEEELTSSFIDELNTLTGWLLGFYIIYYITALYLTTKDFGLSTIPKAFFIYDSQIFKYILAIVFLMHASTSIKVNFFRKSALASIIITPIFLFGSIIVLLNF